MTRCLLLSMDEWRRQHSPLVPKVERVHLQVGTFTCVEPDQLVVTWGDAVRGSWLDGAELVIESVLLVGRCVPCQATYRPDPSCGFRSPCCDHPMEEIVSGRELRIRSVAYAFADQAVPAPAAHPPAPCPAA
nr:hydrogenase maturation nickel metallochaperone HypA [Synechococcus sp. CCY 9618]